MQDSAKPPEDHHRALIGVLFLGGLIGVTDSLWVEGFPLHSQLAFFSGCILFSLVPFLHFTRHIRLTMALAIAGTSVVFLGNFFLYGSAYYLAAGFAIPLSAAMFLPMRDAISALVIYCSAGLGIGVSIILGFWTPPHEIPFQFQLVINGLLIIAAMSLTTIWRERVLKISKQREQKQRRRLETVFKNGYGLLIEADQEGIITFATGRLIEDLGYVRRELIGRQQFSLFAEADRENLPSMAQANFKDVWYDREVRMLDKKGSEKWVRLSGGLVLQGSQPQWINAMQDIHETVVHRNKAFEIARLESLGEVCAGLAHDFNNLLTVIGINAEFITDAALRDEIQVAQKQAVDLTAGLLTFARKQEYRSQKTNLADFLQKMQPLVEKLVGKQIDCQWNLECRTSRVLVDPDQLQQVIINLVTNSLHAMPGGGTLRVACSAAEVPPDYVFDGHAQQCKAFAVLTVADDGKGMDAETRSRAVEPFFTTKPRGKGTGLGLATAHGAVHSAGGVLRIDSEPNVGTIITIYLPRLDDEELGPNSDYEIELEGHPQCDVLVVEDRQEVRTTLQRLLEGSGFNVVTAQDAEEALQLPIRDFDLVVSDVVLPGKSGVDLTHELMANAGDSRVLLISGHQKYDLDVVDRHSGAVRFLPKPFSSESFLKLAKSMVADRGSRTA